MQEAADTVDGCWDTNNGNLVTCPLPEGSSCPGKTQAKQKAEKVERGKQKKYNHIASVAILDS